MITDTFKKCLESILAVQGVQAEIAQGKAASGSSEVPLAYRALAIRSKAESIGTLDEDFIIDELPKDMTLYKPHNLVQVAKDFYATKGWKFTDISKAFENYEEILGFENSKGNSGWVQFDLGSGYRTDGQHQLWVTTRFSK